jgi:hypothetical protein
MKKIIFLLLLPTFIFSQGKSISMVKKSKEPYITQSKDTIKVDMEILLKEGTNADGKFRYVQLLNGFNEPMYQADSRSSFQKEKIKFFKVQNGCTYVFTKFYSINIEAALSKNEIQIIK